MNAARQRAGVVTAEFSLVLVAFLLLVFALMELARVMYLFTTLTMVTQRAATQAANTDFANAAAVQVVRQQAVFRDSPGTLLLGAPVSDAHVRISYLSLSGASAAMMTPIASGALPSCPVNNRIACLKDPYAASCIRLVKAQICDPAITATCEPVFYRSMFSSLPLPVKLPIATAIAPAETLGAMPGEAPCP